MFLISYFKFVTFFVIISGYVNGDHHEECGDDCNLTDNLTGDCFVETKDQFLNNYEESFSSVSSISCRNACLEASFACRSFSFQEGAEKCYLSKESATTKSEDVEIDSEYTYFERTGECSPNCYMKLTEGTYLAGYNHEELPSISRTECIEQCYQDDACLSVDYQETRNICYKQIVNMDMVPSRIQTASYYSYLEKYCGEQEDPCFEKTIGKFYYSFNYDFQRSTTKEDCLKLCKETASCSSINYIPEQKFCFINKELSSLDELISQKNSIYFKRLESCEEDGSGEPSDDVITYDCFDSEDNYFLDDYYQTYTNVDETVCIRNCITINEYCRSASYNRDTRSCHLSKNTKTTEPENYMKDSSSTYFEKQKACKPDCYFTEIAGKYLVGCNDKTVENINSWEECVEQCAYENGLGADEFYCHSAEYNKISKTCYLSKKTDEDNPFGMYRSSVYNYYDRFCAQSSDDKPKCFKEYRNTYMAGYTEDFYKNSNPESCKTSCLEKSYCKSALFSKSKNICYLNSDKQDENGNVIRSNFYYTYYEVTGECGDGPKR